MPTGNAWLDSLSAAAASHAEISADAAAIAGFAVYALMQDYGVVIYEPGVELAQNRVRFVSASVVALLKYQNATDYATAVATEAFTHADDRPMVSSMINGAHSALYYARFQKGDGSGYRRCSIQGLAFRMPAIPNMPELRITIVGPG
jgi:hypothetical protein